LQKARREEDDSLAPQQWPFVAGKGKETNCICKICSVLAFPALAFRALVFPAIAFLVFCPLLLAQQPLNNDSVIKMAKAGLSDDVIITSIQSSPGVYDTSTDALVALKKARISDKVVSAIIVKSAGGGPAGAQSASPAGPPAPAGFGATGLSAVPACVDSVGIYYQDPGGAWQEVPAEVVNFKNAGALKHFATVGIVKEDMNGDVAGNRSRLTLKFPASFILFVPDCTSPAEYQVFRLHVNTDNREFRTVTGGVVHTEGGAAQAAVDFSPKKLAPRVYSDQRRSRSRKGRIRILPPQDASSGKSMASSGKIYTFSFVPE
jgi:uncharacterized SAM-binding protein YcdF (DUF218 family)